MEEKKLLYTKQCRPLQFFLKQSKNPAMLLRYARHFILTMAISDSFFTRNVCNYSYLLFPDFMQKILSIMEFYSRNRPIDIVGFFETYRSNERQLQVYNAGASKVKAFGMHYYGIAVDIINFKNHIPRWNLDYNILVKAVQDIGLTSLRPYEDCHVQFIPVSMQDDWRDFTNNLTKIVQDLLNCKVDGKLGPITVGAILLSEDRLRDYFDSIKIEDL